MVGGAVAPLLINKASADPRFSAHPGLALYGIESYIAVPLNRLDGSYFGTLCALDTEPAQLSEADFDILKLLAQLIAFELEADDQQRRREAEFRALEDIVAIAAHDLRQPLTALYGRAQMVARRARRGGSAADLVPGLETLVVQTRRVVQLSEKLLDIARIETGDFSIDREALDIVALAQQAIEDAQIQAPSHNFGFDAPAQLTIQGDVNRLTQVLRNLLDNAAKYTPAEQGPIQLQIATMLAEADRVTAHVQVSDAGIGVPAADLPHLFERNYRALNATTLGVSGSGLGLYITKQIVEAHGGSIWAEQNQLGGLTLHVILPQ